MLLTLKKESSNQKEKKTLRNDGELFYDWRHNNMLFDFNVGTFRKVSNRPSSFVYSFSSSNSQKCWTCWNQKSINIWVIKRKRFLWLWIFQSLFEMAARGMRITPRKVDEIKSYPFFWCLEKFQRFVTCTSFLDVLLNVFDISNVHC